MIFQVSGQALVDLLNHAKESGYVAWWNWLVFTPDLWGPFMIQFDGKSIYFWKGLGKKTTNYSETFEVNAEKPPRVFLLEVRLMCFQLFMELKTYFLVEIMHSITLLYKVGTYHL